MVCLVVATDEQARAVGRSIVEAAQPGSVLLVHSTVPPSTVVDLADEGKRRGVEVLDVAINGGYEKAELGTMTIMVGGDKATAQYCWPLFEAMAGQIFHVGPVGSGAVAKLVNNQIALSSYATQLEAMRFAAAYGLSEDAVTTVVIASQGDCRGIRTWGRLDRKRDDREEEGIERGGRMAHDLQEATRIAGLRGVTMPVTAVIAELLPSMLRRRAEPRRARPIRRAAVKSRTRDLPSDVRLVRAAVNDARRPLLSGRRVARSSGVRQDARSVRARFSASSVIPAASLRPNGLGARLVVQRTARWSGLDDDLVAVAAELRVERVVVAQPTQVLEHLVAARVCGWTRARPGPAG